VDFGEKTGCLDSYLLVRSLSMRIVSKPALGMQAFKILRYLSISVSLARIGPSNFIFLSYPTNTRMKMNRQITIKIGQWRWWHRRYEEQQLMTTKKVSGIDSIGRERWSDA